MLVTSTWRSFAYGRFASSEIKAGSGISHRWKIKGGNYCDLILDLKVTMCHNISREVVRLTKQILLNLDYNDQQVADLKDLAPDYDWVLDINQVDWSQLEIVIGWHEDLKDLLEAKDHQVKWVQLQSAGADFVPQKLFAELGIILTTSSGMHAKAISETIFGMILGRARKLFQSQKDQADHHWAREEIDLTSLEGKVITIVGTGHIGQQAAKVAKVFDMTTIGVNRSGNRPDFVDQVYTQDQVDQAVAEADYVVNILPLTDETHGFFNQDLFISFKEGAMFINVGRGESVVTDDLMKALDQGQVDFAALDVFEEEPLDPDHPLWDYDNVLVTPHSAGKMDDYLGSLLPIVKKNLKAYMNNHQPAINIVDYDKQY